MSQTIQKHPDLDAVIILDSVTRETMSMITFKLLDEIKENESLLKISSGHVYNAYQWYVNYKEKGNE